MIFKRRRNDGTVEVHEVLEVWLDDGLGLEDRDSLTFVTLGAKNQTNPEKYVPVSFSGLLITAATHSGGAGFRLQPGVGPLASALVAGDLFHETNSGVMSRMPTFTAPLVPSWSGIVGIAARIPASLAASNPGASWSPNYLNGPTQNVTVTGALSVTAPTNLRDGQWMNVFITTPGFDVTFAAAGYQGPQLTFAAASGTIGGSIIHRGTAKYWVAAALEI